MIPVNAEYTAISMTVGRTYIGIIFWKTAPNCHDKTAEKAGTNIRSTELKI
jgi:hypothetical protein